MTKAVIFDMNGVIIVDEKYHKQSWIEFCKKYNFALTDDEFNAQVMGTRDKDTLNFLFKNTLGDGDIDRYSDERDEIVKVLIKGKLSIPEGLIELLDTIQSKNIPLAIATSSRKGYADFIMDKFDLRKYFPIIVTSEDVQRGKPDPEMYLKTAEELKVNPENCLVVEDSISGIKSAKETGMKVIAITSTNTKEDLEKLADYVIENFKDFPLSLL